MSLTILYRDPHRPHEARMTMIADQDKAARMVDELEERGFVVDKITLAAVRRSEPIGERAPENSSAFAVERV
jgi:hypothetical protein